MQRIEEPLERVTGAHHLYHTFGLESSRSGACLQHVESADESCLVHLAGNCLVFIELSSSTRRYLLAIGDRGLGSFVVHPSHKYLAVGETGENPNIYVYKYPQLCVHKILQSGALNSFACMCFSHNGEKLASVSTAPDFMLTIWDWAEQRMLLHSKAFGQEVMRVDFSPHDDGRLTTSGAGHIRFWKMANTFTGLKLQGDIGKFGKVELSDITTFAELPDGKVLSSTDTGALLLWEGNFIKLRVMQDAQSPCHSGEVTFLIIKEESRSIVTAGRDGWIRCWDLQAVMNAEVSNDASADFYIKPTHEISVASDYGISCTHLMLYKKVGDGTEHLIYDVKGKLMQSRAENVLSSTKDNVDTQTHCLVASTSSAGEISILDSSDAPGSCGADGIVHCWDYVARTELFSLEFKNTSTCMTWAPTTLDAQARIIFLGFNDGIVRALYRGESAWIRIQSFKPHNGPVAAVCGSPDGKILATGGEDGLIFFLLCTEFSLDHPPLPYKPIGYGRVPSGVQTICWRNDSKILLVTCQDGALYEMMLHQMPTPKSASSFELSIPVHARTIKQPPLTNERMADDSEGQNLHAPVCCAIYSKNDSILAAFRGPWTGLIVETRLEQNKEAKYHAIGDHTSTKETAVCFLELSQQKNHLIIGRDDGGLSLINLSAIHETRALNIQSHGGCTRLTGACLTHDNSFVLTAGADGLIVVSRVILDGPGQSSNYHQALNDDSTHVSRSFRVALKDGMEFALEDKKYPLVPSDVATDLHDIVKEQSVLSPEDVDCDVYSLEDERLKSDEDLCKAAAEKKKEGTRKVVSKMRREFEDLENENCLLPPERRLEVNEMIVDVGYVQMLEDHGARLIKDLCREHQYNTEKSKKQLKKLKEYFLRDIQKHNGCAMQGQSLRSLLTRHKASSFRTPQLTNTLKQQLRKVHVSMHNEEINSMELQEDSAIINPEQGNLDMAASRKSALTLSLRPVEIQRKQSTLEHRKQMRLQRNADLAAMLDKKQMASIDDPRDIQAIARSKLCLGDYKLKLSADYEVPQDQEITASKKKQQIMMLQENINSIKIRYNRRFLALGSVKKLVFKSIDHCNKQLQSLKILISRLLNALPSDRDIHEKLNFPDSLLNGCLELSQIYHDGEWSDAALAMPTESTSCSLGDVRRPTRENIDALCQIPTVRLIPHVAYQGNPSIVDLHAKWCSANRLYQQGTSTVSKIQQHVASFDRALSELRTEYIPLDSDLKSAELRQNLLLQEHRLLRTFEAQDSLLKVKIDKSKLAKDAIDADITDIDLKLAAQNKDVDTCQNRLTVLEAEFESVVKKSNSFRAFLFKKYMQKVKRPRENQSDDDESTEFDAEDGSDLDDEEDIDNRELDDGCPEGCDAALYDRVLALRDKRLDQEEMLAELKSTRDSLKRTQDQHVRQSTQIEKDQNLYATELQAFQTEKQRHLNKSNPESRYFIAQALFYVASTQAEQDNDATQMLQVLRKNDLKQIRSTHLPEDVKTTVLFLKQRSIALHLRIRRLEAENIAERTNYKELHRAQNRLERAKHAKEAQIVHLGSKCEDLQMLKFGQLIKPEILDCSSSKDNKDHEALAAKLSMLEDKHRTQLRQLQHHQHILKKKLRSATNVNTMMLTKVAALSSRQYDLEQLSAGQKSYAGVTDAAPTIQMEVEERSRLIALVKLQGREIDTLKAEINLLRRKGGHIYAPAQSMPKGNPSKMQGK